MVKTRFVILIFNLSILCFIGCSNDKIKIEFSEYIEIDSERYSDFYMDKLNQIDLYGKINSDSFFNNYESNLLTESNIFRRDGKSLFAKIKGGKEIEIESETDQRDIVYKLIWHYEEKKLALFEGKWMRFSTYYLVNLENGKGINLIGLPYFSQSGERLISLIEKDENAGEGGIQILSYKNGELKKLIEFYDEELNPHRAKWLNEKEFVFEEFKKASAYSNIMPGSDLSVSITRDLVHTKGKIIEEIP